MDAKDLKSLKEMYTNSQLLNADDLRWQLRKVTADEYAAASTIEQIRNQLHWVEKLEVETGAFKFSADRAKELNVLPGEKIDAAMMRVLNFYEEGRQSLMKVDHYGCDVKINSIISERRVFQKALRDAKAAQAKK